MSWRSHQSNRRIMPFLLALAVVCLSSCGGGGTSSATPSITQTPAAPIDDFSLIIEEPNLTLQQQGAYQVEIIAATPLNGFAGTINLTVTGLPAGVTTIPASIPSFSPPSGSSFQITASSGAAIGNSTITVTGTSGALTHTATFTLSVAGAAPFAIQLSPNPLTLVPGSKANIQVSATATPGTSPQLTVTTNPPYTIPAGVAIGSPESFLTPSNPVNLPLQAAVSAQPVENFPLVITATDNSNNSNIAILPVSVSVPFQSSSAATRSTFARTDQSPSGAVYDPSRKLLFVSVETLNEVVVFSSLDGHRVASIPVMYPGVLDESADGSAVYVVSLFASFITTIDPNLFQVIKQTNVPQSQSSFEIATLATGDVLIFSPGAAPLYLWNPTTGSFKIVGTFLDGGMARSADRSKVLLYQENSTGIVASLYDVASQSITSSGTLDGVGQIAISPNGSQIIGFGLAESPTTFLDDRFNILGSVSLGLFPISQLVYSLDGRRVYAIGVDAFAGNVVAVLDAGTFSMIGIVPGFSFGSTVLFSGELLPPLVVDETNMLFGAAFGGMEYLDVSSPGFISVPVFAGNFFQPTLVNVNEPTQVQLTGAGFSSSSQYAAYFGAPPASSLSRQGTGITVTSSSVMNLEAPPGVSTGPANVTLTRSDGFFQVMPEAVSYGPSILMVDPNSGSAAGGDSLDIVGFGFDGSNVQVTIGGKPAPVTQVTGAVPDKQFPTEIITAKTPAGTGNADVVVTTGAGSATVKAGFQYLSSLNSYPITGALDDIVYDQPRQRLYLSNSDHNRVEIFDLAAHRYIAPIVVGNEPAGLALTPDGTLLAVVNSGDGTVSVIDLATAQVVSTWSALNQEELTDQSLGSQALTITPALGHRVLVNVYYQFLLYAGAIHSLNLDTGSLSCSGAAWCTNGTDVSGYTLAAMASIPDGSKVFLADTTGGSVGILDLNANTLTKGFSGDFSDAAADQDANVFAASLGISDAQASRINILAYEPYAASSDVRFASVAGEKLNPSGSLLFIPQATGVDIFDVHTGRLVQHVTLPESIPFDLGGLALDESGTQMFLISNSGILIATLLDDPLSLASVDPQTGPPGTLVTLRGSGYTQGSSVTFGSAPTISTFVDGNTLSATVPSLPSGAVRVTIMNPGGAAYSFDGSFTVQ